MSLRLRGGGTIREIGRRRERGREHFLVVADDSSSSDCTEMAWSTRGSKSASASGNGWGVRIASRSSRIIHWHDPIHLSVYVDDRLVEPETREELVRGRRIHAFPANPEHGDPHSRFDRVIGSHASKGFITAADLLTHASELLDIPLGARERTQLAALDDAGLATLLARIKAERRWP